MTVEFAHDIGSVITIKATGRSGTVVGLYIDEDGVRNALVRYHDKSEARHQTWFREGEIEPGK